MFIQIEIPEQLTALAGRQGGVFNSAQAESLGVTRAAARRMHRDGHWHRVAPGVWSMSADPPWLGLAWAGLLQCHAGVLGGRAAGHLYEICDEPKLIDVWSATRRRLAHPRWRFRRGARRGFGQPARLRVEDTVLDICEEESETGIVSVLAKAVGTRRTTPERLRSAALSTPTLRHRRLVLDILTDVADGVESPLEHRYLVEVEREHGLPVASRQVSVSSGTRSDIGYLEFGLLVELDGQLWHEGLAAWGDMDRDNRHELASFTTLRFSWHAVVNNPCEVASQVAQALRQGGWTGQPHRCQRCR